MAGAYCARRPCRREGGSWLGECVCQVGGGEEARIPTRYIKSGTIAQQFGGREKKGLIKNL